MRGGNSIKSTPPPGRKLVRDWVGLRVRSRRAFANASGTMPAGTVFTVTMTSPGRGMSLRADRCQCCGLEWAVSHIPPDDVEVVS